MAPLTVEERTAFLTALDEGYFDAHSRTTLDGVAAELGVSRDEAADRLRRGMAKVFKRNRDVFEQGPEVSHVPFR